MSDGGSEEAGRQATLCANGRMNGPIQAAVECQMVDAHTNTTGPAKKNRWDAVQAVQAVSVRCPSPQSNQSPQAQGRW